MLKSHLISALKEANYIRFKRDVISSRDDQERLDQIWSSLEKCTSNETVRANRGRLRRTHISPHAANFDEFWAASRRFLHTDDPKSLCGIPIRLYDEQGSRACAPLAPVDKDGAPLTLETAMATLLPDRFPPGSSAQQRVIIHGISPDPDTPILWLSEYFSYPDGFLHICVLPDASASSTQSI